MHGVMGDIARSVNGVRYPECMVHGGCHGHGDCVGHEQEAVGGGVECKLPHNTRGPNVMAAAMWQLACA